MKFKHLINKSKETRRKYEYYLSLGYSDKAAKVLSVVTYGNENLVFLVKQLGRKNVIEKMYSWLHERKEKTPGEAIEAFYDEKYRRPLYEEEEKRRKVFAKARGSRPIPSANIPKTGDSSSMPIILFAAAASILAAAISRKRTNNR